MPIKVSVITPVYNRVHLLEDLANSLVNQTFKDFEQVIVNNNSTEDITPIINKYKNKLTIQYTYEPNQGIAFARNKGIQAARGEYITLMDSDDWYHNEGSLGNLYKEITSDKKIKLVFGAFDYYDHNNKRVIKGLRSISLLPGYAKLYHFLVGNPIIPSTVIMDKKTAQEIKFDTDIHYADDLKFQIDFIAKDYVMTFTPYLTSYWRTNYKEKTSNDKTKLHYYVDKALYKAYKEGSINFKKLAQSYFMVNNPSMPQFTNIQYLHFLKTLINHMMKRSATPYSLILEAVKEGLKIKSDDTQLKQTARNIKNLKKIKFRGLS